MTIFDLVFLLLMLGTVVGVVTLLVAAARRRWGLVQRVGLGMAGVWLAYLAVGAVVALATPQKVLRMDEARCFDEMCFQVAGAERVATVGSGENLRRAQGVLYVVEVESSNRGMGRGQREGGATAWLRDTEGRMYPAVEMDGAGMDAELQAGQSAQTRLVFDVPTEVVKPGVVFGHSYAFNPAKVIAGDEDHFWHKPTVVALGQ